MFFRQWHYGGKNMPYLIFWILSILDATAAFHQYILLKLNFYIEKLFITQKLKIAYLRNII